MMMPSPSSSSEDQQFYDSLERILSSSCSSTSASDDETPHLNRLPLDVWLSSPAPVAERRRRLLLHLGLSSDPVLSRQHRRIPRSAIPPPSPPPPQPISPPDEVRRRTIRNLDTGGEFVVKELTTLREVGTGRQLTMEEFEMCAGRSPIVQELMRRQTTAQHSSANTSPVREGAAALRSRKRGGWLRSIRNAVGGGEHHRRRSSDERDILGGRRSSSATDDGLDWLNFNVLHDGPHFTRVRQYGKSHKELTGLCLSQELPAHNGAIWSIKFSLDGQYLASAGEDCIIHVWQVVEQERKGELLAVERGVEENGNGCGNHNSSAATMTNGSPEPGVALACVETNHGEKKRRVKLVGGRKSVSSDQLVVPDRVFALSEKPVCTFRGHLNDVLDLSWSKSLYLLSSSMDKTVRLWHMSSKSCLKIFSHSDYVTCIQFNPVDDRFFISGSLDEKVRIWSIPDRQVVDWNDLHEMVTAACYTPDGQGALVGSHKGSCHLYHTSENKLHQKSQIDLQNKKRKSIGKKITGFQFGPGSSSEVLVTSADSRIRVIDGSGLVHKFKGFRNTSSQITASLTSNGKYVICASEDSHVYVWRYDAESRPARSSSAVSITQSYEHFHCQDVTVAAPWPCTDFGGGLLGAHSIEESLYDVPRHSAGASYCCDRASATWPEEKLVVRSGKHSPQGNGNLSSNSNGCIPFQSRPAWGMVIVTAGRRGEIRTFQNFGNPVRM